MFPERSSSKSSVIFRSPRDREPCITSSLMTLQHRGEGHQRADDQGRHAVGKLLWLHPRLTNCHLAGWLAWLVAKGVSQTPAAHVGGALVDRAEAWQQPNPAHLPTSIGHPHALTVHWPCLVSSIHCPCLGCGQQPALPAAQPALAPQSLSKRSHLSDPPRFTLQVPPYRRTGIISVTTCRAGRQAYKCSGQWARVARVAGSATLLQQCTAPSCLQGLHWWQPGEAAWAAHA